MTIHKEQRIENLVVRLRAEGFRITPQRFAVIQTLIGSKEHMSADEIFERVRVDFPMIGLATIYKSISVLKEMGEITELNFLNEGSRYDGSGEIPHPHIICSICKTIEDIDDLTEIGGTTIDNFQNRISESTRYKINNYRLDFFGICPKCQSEM